jgi:ubiquinone/menaquinone biosynthesis C-methylase UbiE
MLDVVVVKQLLNLARKYYYYKYINIFIYFRYCDRVIGIDISANQIAHAIQKDNIEYRCNKGEDLTFLESNSIDLITIATTLHWLDIELFVEQVKRVLKPNTGVFAVWTYGPGALDNPKADAVWQEFNQVTLFPYWNSKRWLVDDYYQSLLPLLPYKSTLVEYTIEQRKEITIEQFLGLIETFSASQTFKNQEGEKAYENLIENFRVKLIECYKKTQYRNNDEDESIDLNSIKFTVSSPIRLYLMKKQ